MKAIIDTNVLLAIISKKSPFRWIFDGIVSGRIKICVSTEILLEYKEILQIKSNKIVAENIVSFISTSPFVERTEIFYRFGLIEKDKTDNKFVDCAITSGADLIVSNDRHFQILKSIPFPNVKVVTLEEFDAHYKQELTKTN